MARKSIVAAPNIDIELNAGRSSVDSADERPANAQPGAGRPNRGINARVRLHESDPGRSGRRHHAGHARLLAAEKLGMREVPVIVLSHLSPAQRRALALPITSWPSRAQAGMKKCCGSSWRFFTRRTTTLTRGIRRH